MLVGLIESDQWVRRHKPGAGNGRSTTSSPAWARSIPLGRMGKARGIRQPGLLPVLRRRGLHHRHRDQRRRRAFAGAVALNSACPLSGPRRHRRGRKAAKPMCRNPHSAIYLPYLPPTASRLNVIIYRAHRCRPRTATLGVAYWSPAPELIGTQDHRHRHVEALFDERPDAISHHRAFAAASGRQDASTTAWATDRLHPRRKDVRFFDHRISTPQQCKVLTVINPDGIEGVNDLSRA